MTKIITHTILKSWSPCSDGYKRFCELFPDGADLLTAIDGLVADNHNEWGFWLFNTCREKEFCKNVTDKGYMNTGDMNTGDWNTGDWNTGDMNTGDWNTGDMNTGDWNTGDWNTGYRNTGDWNTGDRNTGDRNTGDWNTGYRNTGDWNKANYQTGYFNTITPDEVLVFNKSYNRKKWIDCKKPSFIFDVIPNVWVSESEMSDQEKIDNPEFYVAEGYLKSIPVEQAWAIAWENASDNDKKLLRELPNFDVEVFKEISGIDINN